MAVGTASDYVALQKERLAKQAGVKKWEDIFLQPYETASQQVQTQAAYDISGAFAQYKQSEMAAMRNTQLGSGFKEQIASDLAAQYGSAFSQIKQQEASNISQIQTSYLQTLAEQEETLMEEGKRFADIEAALYDYMGVDTRALDLAYGAEENGLKGLGWYEGGKITERGIDALDKALNDYYNATEKDRGQLFSEYLAEQNPELYDWYKQNSGNVRELVAGISASDREYDSSERNIEKKDYLQELKTTYGQYLTFEEHNADISIDDKISKYETVKQHIDKLINLGKSRTPGTSTDKRYSIISDEISSFLGVSSDAVSVTNYSGNPSKYEIRIDADSLSHVQKFGFMPGKKTEKDLLPEILIGDKIFATKKYNPMTQKYYYRIVASPKQLSDDFLEMEALRVKRKNNK